MTVKSILDTDILSGYLKGYDANVVRRGNCYAKDHGVFTFTSVTVFEIVSGLAAEWRPKSHSLSLHDVRRSSDSEPIRI